jgi:hypothetical protein
MDLGVGRCCAGNIVYLPTIYTYKHTCEIISELSRGPAVTHQVFLLPDTCPAIIAASSKRYTSPAPHTRVAIADIVHQEYLHPHKVGLQRQLNIHSHQIRQQFFVQRHIRGNEAVTVLKRNYE